MAQLDLRPLTAAEIIDRTFTLFRRHFLLFIGIAAVPQILVLAISLARILMLGGSGSTGTISIRLGTGTGILTSVVVLVITYLATLFSEAATIYAVTDLYLSRTITVSDCLRRAWGQIGTLFGVGILNGLAVLAGFIALVIPAFYVMCRLIVCVPAAIVEQRSPMDALSRSWNLTRENAGRAFLLLLFFIVIAMVAGLLVGLPVGIATLVYKDNPAVLQVWVIVSQVLGTAVNVITQPILLILTSVLYFDLRVRKEGFDLQFLMDPTSERVTPPGTGSIPSIL